MSSAISVEHRDPLQLPFARSFAGHETFAFRYSWLKKGLDFVSIEPEAFQRDDAIVCLGVGKNMVRSIRHWCLSARVVEEDRTTRGRCIFPTELGLKLLSNDGWDPYTEDVATLWLLHWNLCSTGTRLATWYWAFNRFHEYVFTRSGMVESLVKALNVLGWSDVSEGTIKRDVDCFVHTYLPHDYSAPAVDDSITCPLTHLELLVQEPDTDRLRFSVGPKLSLPTSVFAYALAEFWNRHSCERTQLEFKQIMAAEGTPARVFKLDEEAVFLYLEHLESATNGAMTFVDDALVRRVVKKDESALNSIGFLESYYGCR